MEPERSVESRCGAGCCRSSISVSAPFVWRCLSGSTVTPVSTPRSSNRTCRSPASGSRTSSHAFTHGTPRPSRATEPRIAVPHMLPSACLTASAPAISRISWLNPTPHTIAVYASPWSSPSTSQHSLPGGRYPFPGPDLHRMERASFPGAPDMSSPPRLLRLLPDGAVAGWDLHPLESAALARRTPFAVMRGAATDASFPLVKAEIPDESVIGHYAPSMAPPPAQLMTSPGVR